MNGFGNVSKAILSSGLHILCCVAALQVQADSVTPLPRTIQIGALPDLLRPVLAQDCSNTDEVFYKGAEAAPFTHQMQINCSGLLAFGKTRRAEFLFNDGPLGHVWIMVEPDELPGLRVLLEQSFGPVVYTSASYLVFASGTVALRTDPPEVLVATSKLISEITGWRTQE